jgi:hypothetical protein
VAALTPVVISAPTGLWDLTSLIPTDGRQWAVIDSTAWEIDHLRAAAYVFIDRFLFLKESCRVLQPARFWADVDEHESAWVINRPACYLGVYQARDIRKGLRNARVTTKKQSINYEFAVHRLAPMNKYPTIYPEITDKAAKRIETGPDGAIEYVIGNDIFEKHKGTAGCKVCYDRSKLTNGPGTSSGVCRHRIAQAEGVAAGLPLEQSYALLAD